MCLIWKTAQSVLVRWYHEGLDAFEHTCPTGRTIYDSVYNDLINYLASPDETEGFDDLIKNCREQHEALKAQLEQGRDRSLRSIPTVAKKPRHWQKALKSRMTIPI